MLARENQFKAWLFPGIGSRFVGMGADLLGKHPAADRLVQEAGDLLGYDIPAICLEGSGRKVVPPRQEATVIYVLDCAYAAVLGDAGLEPRVVCGHSLGTWAAGFAAGIYDFATGLQLVTNVEQLMEMEIDSSGQALGVIIGLDSGRIEQLCQETGQVFVANLNSRWQHVIGGTRASVQAVLDSAQRLRAHKVKLLGFPRAMHTPLVRPVTAGLRRKLSGVRLDEPRVPLVSCHDGAWLETAAEVGEHLSTFLHLPVRWEKAVRGMRERFVEEFLEVGPGTVLTDLMGFIDQSASRKTASDVLGEVQAA